MRTNCNKKIVAIGILILFILAYVYFSILHHARWYQETYTGSVYTCEDVIKNRKKLIWLSNTVHDILNRHDLPTFLIYGSIWGALRGYKGPLMWDYDVDIAALMTDFTTNKMESIIADLQLSNISTNNQIDQSGLFKFKHNSGCLVELYFFKKSWFGQARRVGWEVYLLQIHYYYIHSFPFILVENVRQLPRVQFGDRDGHVPRGGIEIMKYLYRNTWKIEFKPKGYNCSKTLIET